MNSCSQHPFNNIFSEGIIGDFPSLACPNYDTHSFLRKYLTLSRDLVCFAPYSACWNKKSANHNSVIYQRRQSLQMPTSGVWFPLSLFPLLSLAMTEPKYIVISGISKQGILHEILNSWLRFDHRNRIRIASFQMYKRYGNLYDQNISNNLGEKIMGPRIKTVNPNRTVSLSVFSLSKHYVFLRLWKSTEGTCSKSWQERELVRWKEEPWWLPPPPPRPPEGHMDLWKPLIFFVTPSPLQNKTRQARVAGI